MLTYIIIGIAILNLIIILYLSLKPKNRFNETDDEFRERWNKILEEGEQIT